MPKNDLNVTLKGIDELLFSTEEQRQEEKREQVQQIPIDELHPFTNHPFKVVDDVRLTNLIPELLNMVDEKKISFNPAVELSYLSPEQQQEMIKAMDDTQNAPSVSQAKRIKELAQKGQFTSDAVVAIMGEEKKGELDTVTIKNDILRKYFPRSYTPRQMEEKIIQLLDEVFDAFLEEYQYQKVIGFCTDEIDGYSGFVFCTGDGKVYLPNAINRTIRSICADYNKEEESKAKEENRDPVLLPKFSCHILRHTFCTRFCENETNLKVIQEIMGHADISTTMDVYAEATQEKKKESMTSLQSALLVR